MLSVGDGTITAVDTGSTGDAINPQWSRRRHDAVLHLGEPAAARTSSAWISARAQTTRVTERSHGHRRHHAAQPGALGRGDGEPRGGDASSATAATRFEFIDTTLAPAPPPTGPLASTDAALLPPAPRPSSTVARLLAQPALALPPADDVHGGAVSTGASARRHRPAARRRRPSGSFGTYVSGGIAFQFSDVLGNHVARRRHLDQRRRARHRASA